MVSIAICDDDSHYREAMHNTLKTKLPSPCAIYEFADGAELLRAIEQRQCLIDLVLLDIRMPLLNGIQTARRLRALYSSMVIILITGYGEYVYEGYDVRAFHFLKKPVDDDRLLAVLADAIKQVEETRADYLAVNKRSVCVYIPFREILYIEAISRKLIVHTDTEQLEYYDKLSELEQWFATFTRIHRCYLVNREAVRYVDKKELWVYLRDGHRLAVSRRRMGWLLEELLGRL